MSLGVVIKGPEGVVLAADSRVTVSARMGADASSPPIHVNFDNATKLLSFSPPNNYVGAVTYGTALIGSRTPHSYIPELTVKLERERENVRLSVKDFAAELRDFYVKRWQAVMPTDYTGQPLTFIVGGYDTDAAYGRVFLFSIPTAPEPQEKNSDDFGMTWGGQIEIASRLIHGFDPRLLVVLQEAGVSQQQLQELAGKLKQLEFMIPYQVLPLQDCVDLALFLIRTTAVAQKLAVVVRGVGGPIEVAYISGKSGLNFVQRKEIRGEQGFQKG
jgi:hypothetical protein